MGNFDYEINNQSKSIIGLRSRLSCKKSDWLFDRCHKSGCVCFIRKSARSIIHEVVNILILCMVIPIGKKHVALHA